MKPKLLIILILLIAFLTSGCITIKGSKQPVNSVGGVFKSVDKGVTWKQSSSIPTKSGAPKNFNSLDIANWSLDPSDHKAIYFNSVGNGMYYTYDSGETWQFAGGLGNNTIRSTVVDPQDKCTIYAALGRRVMRSSDCCRTWDQIYIDGDAGVTVDSVAIDHFDNSVIYLSVSRGDILKSFDRGISWQTAYRFKSRIPRLLIDPNDSRTIYGITSKKGIIRSFDGGLTWSDDINDAIKEFNLGLIINDLILFKNNPEMIYLSSSRGMIRSLDLGESWEKINIIPPENKAQINAVAVDPENTDNIYYVTNTTLYRSIDGGANWTPAKLPTSRAGSKLLIDPEEPRVVYMGLKTIQKK